MSLARNGLCSVFLTRVSVKQLANEEREEWHQQNVCVLLRLLFNYFNCYINVAVLLKSAIM